MDKPNKDEPRERAPLEAKIDTIILGIACILLFQLLFLVLWIIEKASIYNLF